MTQNKTLPHSDKGDLTQGDIKKHLVRLTVPMIWGMLAIIAVQLTDTYFIAMLGTNELAGISFTFPVTMVMTHFIFGLNIAMSSVVSRMIGQKNINDARRVVLHGIIMALTLSSVIAILCAIFLEPLFMALGANAQTLPVILEYMPLWLLGSVILSVPVNGNSAMRAAGDTFTPGIIMISMALINLALNPVLIFGYFGLPPMGVFGAALATFISYSCAAAIGLYCLVIRKKLIPQDGLHLNLFKDSVMRLIFIAIPAGIANIIKPASGAVIVALLAAHGPEAVAAYGVVSRVEAFAFILVIALALGLAPIIGQNWGAGIYKRVHDAIALSIKFNFVWSFTVAALMGVFARDLAMIFSDDPGIIHHATHYFWIVPMSYAFGNLVFGWCSVFNATGMPQRAFMMIAVSCLAVTIPAAYIGNWLYGAPGIFIAISLANAVTGIYYHFTSWRVLLKQEAPLQTVTA
jgi:putative MATE family efflux protein